MGFVKRGGERGGEEGGKEGEEKGRGKGKGGGKGRERGGNGRTIRLLKHPLHGARAAATGHGDVEVVVVGGCHCCFVSSRFERV